MTSDEIEAVVGVPLETLRREAAWVRRLAVRLLRDETDADDVIQEVWLRAMRSPPRSEAAVRSWLGRVVRRLVLDRRRGEARTRRRDEIAGRARGAAPATIDVVTRAETHRRVVEAVLRLSEPARTTVLLRYFDDLDHATIAERTGAPNAEAVRGRLRRARATLRDLLAEPGGDRRSLGLALAGLLADPEPETERATPRAEPVGGAAAMGGVAAMTLKTKAILASAMVLVVTAAIGVATRIDFDGASGSRDAGIDPPRIAERSGAAADGPADPEAAGGPAETLPASGVVLRGRAVGDGDVPYAESAIQWRIEAVDGGAAPLERRVTTDESGRFELPVGDVKHVSRIVPIVAGAAVMAPEVIVAPGAPVPADLWVLVSSYDAVLAGRVVDATTGTPIEGARVSAGSSAAEGPAVADAAGGFRVAVSSRFGGHLWARADGYAWGREIVHLEPGARIENVVLRLGPERVVEGDIVDETGAPVAGAEITTFFVTRAGAPPATSGEDGRFRLPGLQRDRVELLTATKSGFTSAGAPVAPRATTARLVLTRGVTLAGTVRDDAGRPIAGAKVVIASEQSGREATISDAAGRFQLNGLAPGGLVLAVRAPDRALLREPWILEAAGASDVTLTMAPAERITGRVVDDTGGPIFAAHISAELDRFTASGTISAEDGSFTLRDLPSGPVAIHAVHADFQAVRGVVVEGGTRDCLVTMPAAARLAGRVVDEATGEPVPHFRVRFVPAKLAEGETAASGYSVSWVREGVSFQRSDGVWTADESLRPGDVLGVEASAHGYAPSVVDRVVLRRDGAPDDLVIRLRRGGRFEGFVVASGTGKPVPDARVQLGTATRPLPSFRYGEQPAFATTETDAGGAFAVDGVPEGELHVRIEHDAFAPRSLGPVDLSASPLRIELSTGGAISGTVVDASGALLAGRTVRLVSREGHGTRTARTGTDGAFAFERLPAGRWGLALLSSGPEATAFMRRGREIDLGEAERQSVAFGAEGRASLVGRISTTRMLPAETVAILILRPSSGEALSFTERVRDGGFRFDGLPAGEYDVLVHHFDPSTRSQVGGRARVTVAEDEVGGVSVEVH